MNTRLSWNEIRRRATVFAKRWEGKGYEKGDTQGFYQELFDCFGMPVRRVASFEEPVKKLGNKRGFIDLFWKGMLLVEQKSKGRDLAAAKTQALDYFPGLEDDELPRYLLVSDFQTFELYDLDKGTDVRFTLQELPKKVQQLAFIVGAEKREFKDQDPVNIRAAEVMGRLHDALKASGYSGSHLERFLVRLVFCLFADDTGIFDERDAFTDLIEQRTKPDGSDLGALLSQLFDVLNTPVNERQTNLDEDLARFPYINGGMFADTLKIPSFDSEMRKRLIAACRFDWSLISPAIFGSLFQSVMSPEERRKTGAHYTTEQNIMKVIQPLFLDALQSEFGDIQARKDARRWKDLRGFHQRLSHLRFLDPACGSGNFLVIAYRELRDLELKVLLELQHDPTGSGKQMWLAGNDASLVTVDQFYGVEIDEFAVRIAETAMFMMDHIMNNRLSDTFGETYIRIPLIKSPHIVHNDALEIDWASVLPPDQCSFILGNPPFIGAKYQSHAQRAQVRRIASLGKSGGTLDYVAAWFLKAAEYVAGRKIGIGFVATNSITQGEQVGQLWPLLLDQYGLEIAFAHRTFAWGSDARGKAHVHVVIVGLEPQAHCRVTRTLFSYDDIHGDPFASIHKAISPYLIDGSALGNPHLVIAEASKPQNGLPPLVTGSKPIDGGNFILSAEERSVMEGDPRIRQYIRPYIGAKEFLNGGERSILFLGNASPADIKNIPALAERVRLVREFRADRESLPTKQMALTPTQWHITVVPERPFLVVPESSSERREYLPIAWLAPPVVPSNLVRVVLDAELWHFALLTSAMHMAWLRHVGGRLKSDYRYSIGTVYNTFPTPIVDGARKTAVEVLAQEVLDARVPFKSMSLAELYDPDAMPDRLRTAHRKLDREVDKLYRAAPFRSELERATYLLGLYESRAQQLTLGGSAQEIRKRTRLST